MRNRNSKKSVANRKPKKTVKQLGRNVNVDWREVRQIALKHSVYGGLAQEFTKSIKPIPPMSLKDLKKKNSPEDGKDEYIKEINALVEKCLYPWGIHLLLGLYRIQSCRDSALTKKDTPKLNSLNQLLKWFNNRYRAIGGRLVEGIPPKKILFDVSDGIGLLMALIPHLINDSVKTKKPGPPRDSSADVLLWVFLYLVFEGKFKVDHAIGKITNLLNFLDEKHETSSEEIKNAIYRAKSKLLSEFSHSVEEIS